MARVQVTTTTRSFTTTGKPAQYDTGCASQDTGSEHVLAFVLDAAGDLRLDWTQTGDHVFGLYAERGGECVEHAIDCFDPAVAPTGSTAFPRLEPGNYLLITDAFAPGSEGDVTVGLTAL